MKIEMKDLYWCAAFIDGEGSITLSGKTPRVDVSQSDKELLKRLQNFLGGWISNKPRFNKLSKNGCYVWGMSGSRAVGVMMTLYSIMSQKRKRQIEKVLKVWRDTPNGRGEKHCKSVLSNSDAKKVMIRIINGEYMSDICREFNINHTVIGGWLRGEDRPYLIEELNSKGLFYIPNRKTYRGEDNPNSKISDELALEAVRRVVILGETQTKVGKDLGIVQARISQWLSGKVRPYLLARIKEEDQQLASSVAEPGRMKGNEQWLST